LDETEDKPSIEELAQKIEDLLVVLDAISKDLRELVTSMKEISAQAPAPTPPAAPPVTAPVSPGGRTVEDVRIMFPEELEGLLMFEEKGEYIVIKPRQYLGSENFAKIASIVRGAGGEYISAGRDSHFRIPR